MKQKKTTEDYLKTIYILKLQKKSHGAYIARALGVSRPTVSTALKALEQEGYVYSVPGKGSFAARREEIDSTRREELLARLDEVAAELMLLGVTPEQIAQRCAKRKEEESHD